MRILSRLLSVLLLLPLALAAEEVPAESTVRAPGKLSPVDLNDPRLDEKNLQPAPQIELQFPVASLICEATIGDNVAPRIREMLRQRLKEYREAVEKYEEQWKAVRKADPKFDAKVRAAREVAAEHVRKLSGPRGGGILPTYKCTEPWAFSRAYEQAVGRFQTSILQEKHGLRWSPPPELPEDFFAGADGRSVR